MKHKTRQVSPRLKAGVKFWRSDLNRQLFIGTRFQNFLIPDQFGSLDVEPALHLLAKGKLDQEQYAALISALKGLHLIDTSSTELNYQYRENVSQDIGSISLRSVAEENFYSRFEIEAHAISGVEGVNDGGVSRVLDRRSLFIEVHGVGRLLFPLLANLISSGFDNCTLGRSFDIHPTDLIGGYLRRSDLGFDGNRKLSALKDEVSLYPEVLGSGGKPDLIISIGAPAPEVLQSWLSQGISQLFVDYENSFEIRIGPYVEPRNGACYNCLRIAESERGYPSINALNNGIGRGVNGKSSQRSELASSLSSYGASLIALEVLRIADTGSSNLHQKSLLISMLNHLEPQVTSWERSPRCGCNWS